jgi:hypothetical protein
LTGKGRFPRCASSAWRLNFATLACCIAASLAASAAIVFKDDPRSYML